MDVELCPKCRSWRVTETTLGEDTRCVCQECSFNWSVSAAGKFESLPQRPAPANRRGVGHAKEDKSPRASIDMP
jgi:transposase-like protein